MGAVRESQVVMVFVTLCVQRARVTLHSLCNNEILIYSGVDQHSKITESEKRLR